MGEMIKALVEKTGREEVSLNGSGRIILKWILNRV
jgi:hypothetical protein